MKFADVAVIRARAKAPLATVQVLHLSNAGIECLRNVQLCPRLESLYANDNRVRNVDDVQELNRLWRVDLNDNALRHIHPLASFPYLGFLFLERNELRFDDLLCLRDVNLVEIRVQGNPALHVDNSTPEYRMKLAALLPNAWIIDGHFVSSLERQNSIDQYDFFVQYLIEHGENVPAKIHFGSSAEMWGRDNLAPNTLQHDFALKMIECIRDQPVKNPHTADIFRLKCIVDFHNAESKLHNSNLQFAPTKFTANAKVMPRIHLDKFVGLCPRQRLELIVLLGAFLEFKVDKVVVTEALVIALLDSSVTAADIEETLSLPPYGITAIIALVHWTMLEGNDSSVLHVQSTASADQHYEAVIWKSLPEVFTTLVCLDKDIRLANDDVDGEFAVRCGFAIQLLHRTAAFPSISSLTDRPSRGEASKKENTGLLGLVEAARPINTLESSDIDFDAIRRWLNINHITQIKEVDQRPRLPWKSKELERGYPQPWKNPFGTNAMHVRVLGMSHSMSSLESLPVKRRPKVGEWIEVRPKLYLRVLSVTSDGRTVLATRPNQHVDSSDTFTFQSQQLTRMSSSMWRLTKLTESEAGDLIERLNRDIANSTTKTRIGKLHRDSESFHRHGAARNQGFPNVSVAEGDIDELERLKDTGDQPIIPTVRAVQPVAVYSANDTLDANYVLASPDMIAIQNFCAAKQQRDLGRSPAGLWHPIQTTSYGVVAGLASPVTQTPTKKQQQPTPTRNSQLGEVRVRRRSQQQRRDGTGADLDDWGSLQEDMQAILGMKPRTPHEGPPPFQSYDDVLCFMTSVPPDGVVESVNGAHSPGRMMSPKSEAQSPHALSMDASTTLEQSQQSGPLQPAPASHKKRLHVPQPNWHAVATKPQLLVSAATLAPVNAVAALGHGTPQPLSLPQSLGSSSTASASTLALPSVRVPSKLPRCEISLPTLSSATAMR